MGRPKSPEMQEICLKCTLKECNEKAAGCGVRIARRERQLVYQKKYRAKNAEKYKAYWKARWARIYAEKVEAYRKYYECKSNPSLSVPSTDSSELEVS